MNKKAEDFSDIREPESHKDPHDVGLLAGSMSDEINFFLEELEQNPKELTQGDRQLLSVLQVSEDFFHRVSSVDELKNGVNDLLKKLNTINSRYAPGLANRFWKSLDIFNTYPSNTAIKVVQAVRMIFASPEFRREDSGDSYQSTQVGNTGIEQQEMPNTVNDSKVMEKNTEFPKSPDLKSNDPLAEMNGKIHEIDSLIHQATEKAKSLQIDLAEFSGSNTETKIELVSNIGKLVRRLQQNMDWTAGISGAISKRLRI